ncbi:MAG: putative toxin-antitoxin system toxin component, PIN family [Dissulfurispiraceae bacterium]
MPVKVVIDTNIWISGLIATSATATKLVDEWKTGKFSVVISEQQILEIYEVLTRPKFSLKYHIPEKEIRDLVTLIKDKAEHVTLKNDITVCRDPDDNIIIETAIRGKANYLLTGDKDISDDKKISSLLLQYGVIVISLSNFLPLINKA